MPGKAQQLAAEFGGTAPDSDPCLQQRQDDLGKSAMPGKQPPDFGFEPASFGARHDQTEGLHQASDLVGKLGRDTDQTPARCNQRADQHAVVALHPHLAIEACLRQMRETVGIIGIGLVRCHVECCLCMPCVDADRGQSFGAQGMEEPHRQRAGLEHDTLSLRRMSPQYRRNRTGVRGAFAAPDPPAASAHRNRRLFQGYVQTDIVAHGCSPFDVWARCPS